MPIVYDMPLRRGWFLRSEQEKRVMRGTPHALCRAILAVTVLYPAVSSAANTSTWTGAGGDFLWGDSVNWSDGVPGSDTAAVIPDIPAATIDLGGQSRPVD